MYEELVMHLRECAKIDPSENTFSEAADAIEELIKDRDNWRATAKDERAGMWHWFDNYQRDIGHRMPLPEPPKEET